MDLNKDSFELPRGAWVAKLTQGIGPGLKTIWIKRELFYVTFYLGKSGNNDKTCYDFSWDEIRAEENSDWRYQLSVEPAFLN